MYCICTCTYSCTRHTFRYLHEKPTNPSERSRWLRVLYLHLPWQCHQSRETSPSFDYLTSPLVASCERTLPKAQRTKDTIIALIFCLYIYSFTFTSGIRRRISVRLTRAQYPTVLMTRFSKPSSLYKLTTRTWLHSQPLLTS